MDYDKEIEDIKNIQKKIKQIISNLDNIQERLDRQQEDAND